MFDWEVGFSLPKKIRVEWGASVWIV